MKFMRIDRVVLHLPRFRRLDGHQRHDAFAVRRVVKSGPVEADAPQNEDALAPRTMPQAILSHCFAGSAAVLLSVFGFHFALASILPLPANTMVLELL